VIDEVFGGNECGPEAEKHAHSNQCKNCNVDRIWLHKLTTEDRHFLDTDTCALWLYKVSVIPFWFRKTHSHTGLQESATEFFYHSLGNLPFSPRIRSFVLCVLNMTLYM
jgi:hypothetical protein